MLSALGASILSLTGCLSDASTTTASTTTTETPTTTTSETPSSTPRGGHREIGVTSIGSIPADAPLVPSVEVLQPFVTDDQPARISVKVTNTADQPVWHTGVRIPAFSSFITQAASEGRRLLLLQPDAQYATRGEGCWRADLSEPQINNAYSNVVTDTRYDPGDTTATQFDIYGHPDNTGPCLPPGEYPIDAAYAVSDDATTDTVEWEYRWGFSLTVADS